MQADETRGGRSPGPRRARPVVAVPARDEEARLPRLINALARQTALASLEDALDVVIVVNNSSDASARVASEAASCHPRLRLDLLDVAYPAHEAHVGTARRQAMDRAAVLAPDGIILTTDADAVPADDWIARTLDAFDGGADLVGGHIVGDPDEEARLGPGFARRASLHARYAQLRDELAALIDPLDHDPWPRHQDHTGASIAVRSATYRALGGLEPLPFREDLAFVAKVRAAGLRVVHPLDVVVTVSARTEGRAPGGMAACLRTWLQEEEALAPVLLECPARVEARLRLRKALRDLPPASARAHLQAQGLLTSDDDAREVPALIEAHAADDPDAPASTPAVLAIADLEQRIALLREGFRAA